MAIRENVGPGVTLTADFNGAYDSVTAIHIIEKLTPAGLTMAEQPVPATDLAGMAMVTAAVQPLILADQSINPADDVYRWRDTKRHAQSASSCSNLAASVLAGPSCKRASRSALLATWAAPVRLGSSKRPKPTSSARRRRLSFRRRLPSSRSSRAISSRASMSVPGRFTCPKDRAGRSSDHLALRIACGCRFSLDDRCSHRLTSFSALKRVGEKERNLCTIF